MSISTFTSRPRAKELAASPPSRRGLAGRVVALVGAAGLVVAAFLPWDGTGRLGLDAGLLTLGAEASLPTVAVTLVALAGVAAVPALLGDWGVPRTVAALTAGGLAVLWLAAGPDGAFATGVTVTIAASVLLLVAAALATGGAAAADLPAARRARTPPTDRSGHRMLDHTADTAFEAWGPTRAEALATSVGAFVSSFADTSATSGESRRIVEVGPARDEDLLVDLLGEVIYLLDVEAGVVVGADLRDDGATVTGHLDVAPLGAVRRQGAVPKAITYHGLVVEERPGGWVCRVTIDV